jgi:cell division septation protein DedD
MPVLILYWTAEVLEDDSVTFRADVYGRDAPVLRALGGKLASAPKQRPPSAASAAAKPAPAAAKPAIGGWVVQVASVTNSVGAQRLVDELAEQGFVAVITRSQVDGKSYHRVRLGPLASRQEADAMVESLRMKTGYKGQALRR